MVRPTNFYKYLLFCLFIGFSALFSFPLAAQDPEAYIIKIEGEPIPLQDFEYLYNKNYQNDNQGKEQESPEEYLKRFIAFKLKVHEAFARGYHKSEEFLGEFESYRQQLAQPYLTDEKVLNDLVKATYERYTQEVKASHILIQLPSNYTPKDTLAAYQKINQLYEQAQAGEDFGELAQQHSQDPSAATNKGDLGYFTALQMVYPFENAAFETPVGGLSKPFRTRFGYHILKVYDKRPSKGSVRTAHIMIQAREGMPETELQQAEEKIEAIYERLTAGGDWDTLTANLSEDRATKDKGGELKWFSSGSMVPEFAEAAFQLENPGDISAPVKTPFGWHIIKLLERKPVASFEAMRAELTEKVKRDARAEKAVTAFLESAKKQYNFEENSANKKAAFGQLNEQLSLATWAMPENNMIGNKPLMSIGDKKILVKDFWQYASEKQVANSGMGYQAYGEKLYQDYLKQTLTAYVEAKLPEKYPAYSHLVKEYKEGLLLFRIMEEEVWNKASTDSAGLANFFEQRQEDYQWEKRVVATIVEGDDEAAIERVAPYVEQGSFPIPNDETFTLVYGLNENKWGEENTDKVLEYANKLKIDKNLVLKVGLSYVKKEKKKHEELTKQRWEKIKALLESRGIQESQFERTFTERIDREKGDTSGGEATFYLYSRAFSQLTEGDLAEGVNIEQGKYELGDHPAITEAVFNVGSHRTLVEGKPVMVSVSEVIPTSPKALEDVKGMIISAYQDYLEKQWVAELREKYPVEINRAALDTIEE